MSTRIKCTLCGAEGMLNKNVTILCKKCDTKTPLIFNSIEQERVINELARENTKLRKENMELRQRLTPYD